MQTAKVHPLTLQIYTCKWKHLLGQDLLEQSGENNQWSSNVKILMVALHKYTYTTKPNCITTLKEKAHWTPHNSYRAGFSFLMKWFIGPLSTHKKLPIGARSILEINLVSAAAQPLVGLI